MASSAKTDWLPELLLLEEESAEPVEETSDTIEAPPDLAPLLVESGEVVAAFIDG